MNAFKYLIPALFLALFTLCNSDKTAPEEDKTYIDIYTGADFAVKLLLLEDEIAIKFSENIAGQDKVAFIDENNLTPYKMSYTMYNLIYREFGLEHFGIDGDSYNKSKILSANPIVDYATPVLYNESLDRPVFVSNQFGIHLDLNHTASLDSLNSVYDVSITEIHHYFKDSYTLMVNRPDLYNVIELSAIYRKVYFIRSATPRTSNIATVVH